MSHLVQDKLCIVVKYYSILVADSVHELGWQLYSVRFCKELRKHENYNIYFGIRQKRWFYLNQYRLTKEYLGRVSSAVYINKDL